MAITKLTISSTEPLPKLKPQLEEKRSFLGAFFDSMTPEEKAEPSYVDLSSERLGELVEALAKDIESRCNDSAEMGLRSATLLGHQIVKSPKVSGHVDFVVPSTRSGSVKEVCRLNFALLPEDGAGATESRVDVEEDNSIVEKKSERQGSFWDNKSAIGDLVRQWSSILGDDKKGFEAVQAAASTIMCLDRFSKMNSATSTYRLAGLTQKDVEVAPGKMVVLTGHIQRLENVLVDKETMVIPWRGGGATAELTFKGKPLKP